jgi:hypothetical protein
MNEHTSLLATLLEWSGLGGILAIIAGVLGYGRLQQRVSVLEEQAKQSADNGEVLARLDERTKAMQAAIEDLKQEVRS